MPKLFVISDIHSYLAPMKIALAEAGFNPEDENHWLIVCGDAFDRGNDSVEVLRYLMSLERKVLIKGNHDILFRELCERNFAYSYDKSNGTLKTVHDLGKHCGDSIADWCQGAWDRTAAYRDLLVNYFETENYIFVHSWIPTTQIDPYQCDYRDDWRDANDSQWEDATWGNPFKLAQDELNQTGKTIVFGHWHCSYGHALTSGNIVSEFGKDAIWDIYHNKELGIVGIDRCTAHTGDCNVFVIEDNFLN